VFVIPEGNLRLLVLLLLPFWFVIPEGNLLLLLLLLCWFVIPEGNLLLLVGRTTPPTALAMLPLAHPDARRAQQALLRR
jgi:hypothetical protein